MKKFAAFLLLCLLIICPAMAEEPAVENGVYTSVVETGESQMTVTVTLDESLIKGISLTADEEEIDVSAPEVTGLLQAIVTGQTLAVDVNSAECTGVCEAILCGVEDCVRQAGCDVERLRTHHLCQNQHGYHHVDGCASHAGAGHHGGGHHTSNKGGSHHSSSQSGGHHGGSSGHNKGHH